MVRRTTSRWSRIGIAMAVLASTTALAIAPQGLADAEAAPPVGPDKLADFEAGTPAGWFAFNGASSVNGTPVSVPDTDALARPGQVGANGILALDFNVTDFGGFGQDQVQAFGSAQNWSQTDGMSFWFNGTGSGLTYQAEISDNRSDPSTDTAERFDVTFTDDSAGWRRVQLPWSSFSRATDFQPGGAPNDGLTLTEVWAWAIVLPAGADTVHFDDISVDNRVVDDFENLGLGGLPNGSDVDDGAGVGFFPFADTNSTVTANVESTPPAPLNFETGQDNQAVAIAMDVTAFAGLAHLFSDDAYTQWTPQDWTAFEGIGFWLHGENTGTDLFFDLIENRGPGSTRDDAERWSITLKDDVAGWRYIEVPFDAFARKDIGNGAPNDGFTREAMHGWAFGALSTGGDTRTWYLDGLSLYGDAGDLPLTVSFSSGVVRVDEGATADIKVSLNRALVEDDLAPVTVNYVTEVVGASPDRDFTPTSGTLTFEVGGPREQSFDVETFDNPKFTGDKRIGLRLSEASNAALGGISQASILIVDTDSYDGKLVDDFEGFPYLWEGSGNATLTNAELTPADANAIPGQGEYEGVLNVQTPIAVDVAESGGTCATRKGVVTIKILGSTTLDVADIDHTTIRVGDATEVHVKKKTSTPLRHEDDVNNDGFTDLVVHVKWADTGLDCDAAAVVTGETFDGQAIGAGGPTASWTRDFPIGQDWTDNESLRFWYYGSGSGQPVSVNLKDNRAADPGPDGWNLAFSDEFNEPAGTPPNEANWAYEIGDVTPDGKIGWGNEERQYYTDDPENASTDGQGNLNITLKAADGDLQCYYGACEYTSARLVSADRQEFAYGRMEARIKTPDGSGLWPAFWSLGTDINRNPWPNAGEIDVMEFVGRLPNEIFGTIHGPGYAGGASFSGKYDFGTAVSEQFHTYSVEWEPEKITWFVDGIQYHQATPASVAPNPWVFEKPFFLLLNMAIGGNFGGAIDPNIDLPQSMSVDYVRVFQGPDTAERFEASFVDDTVGWRQVTVPFDQFSRSAEQSTGAPNDGLGLTEVWGYGFALPDGSATGELLMDQVRLIPQPPPTELVVQNLNDSGSGSLRDALSKIAPGGTITFAPALAGGTVALDAPLTLTKDVTVDASAAAGLTMSGQDASRVLIVNAGVSANVSDLTIRDGFGYQLAGAVLNNGNLVLDKVTVTENRMFTDAGDFWQGGGGIYNADGASLNLIDSTVSDNESSWSGGGVYSFFNSTTTVVRSTISGNIASDVGGGLRNLGDASLVNSTVSGNTSTAWHGGGIFHTDGQLDINSSTLTGNIAPAGTASGVIVATFGAPASMSVANSILNGNGGSPACAIEGGGAATITSAGSNLISDGSCSPVAGDLSSTAALLGVLADNGGPTLTHALSAGSPAIDAADSATCPAVDQRGIARPAGACDIGAFEFVP